MTSTDIKMALVYVFVFSIPFALFIGCSNRDKCNMYANDLGIDQAACNDEDIATKAVQVVEKKRASAKTDAENRLDGMLNPNKSTHVAELAAKLRTQLNECLVKLDKQCPRQVECAEIPIESDTWKNSR